MGGVAPAPQGGRKGFRPVPGPVRWSVDWSRPNPRRCGSPRLDPRSRPAHKDLARKGRTLTGNHSGSGPVQPPMRPGRRKRRSRFRHTGLRRPDWRKGRRPARKDSARKDRAGDHSGSIPMEPPIRQTCRKETSRRPHKGMRRPDRRKGLRSAHRDSAHRDLREIPRVWTERRPEFARALSAPGRQSAPGAVGGRSALVVGFARRRPPGAGIDAQIVRIILAQGRAADGGRESKSKQRFGIHGFDRRRRPLGQSQIIRQCSVLGQSLSKTPAAGKFRSGSPRLGPPPSRRPPPRRASRGSSSSRPRARRRERAARRRTRGSRDRRRTGPRPPP